MFGAKCEDCDLNVGVCVLRWAVRRFVVWRLVGCGFPKNAD